MKFKKIVLLDFEETSLRKEDLKELSKLAGTIVTVASTDKQCVQKIYDADILLTRIFTKVDKQLIDACPDLKYVGVFATSFSAIDTAYAAKKGIAVTNLAGYSTEAVAEFVFASLLEHVRELERAKQNARKENFEFKEFLSWELKDKTFGIIGLGNLGKRVAEIALGFGMNVKYWSRNRKRDYEKKGVTYKKLEEVLKSDVVTIHLAHNPQTEGLITKKQLSAIPKETILMSFTSLKIMEYSALVSLLKKNAFTLITDSFDHLSDQEKKDLENLSNIISYPPVAFRTKEAIDRQRALLVENLKQFSKGKVQNKVN
jgi:glycerate dehydrogenase